MIVDRCWMMLLSGREVLQWCPALLGGARVTTPICKAVINRPRLQTKKWPTCASSTCKGDASMETGAKWRILINEHNLQTPIEQKHREDHKVVTKNCVSLSGIYMVVYALIACGRRFARGRVQIFPPGTLQVWNPL